jgi:hypothetical protein
MMPGRYTIDCYQGASWSETWTWKDAAGVPVPLGGYTARMQWRDRTGAVVMEFSTANGRIVLAAAGDITPSASALDLAAVSGTLDWDILLTAPGGFVTPLLAGDVRVTPGVTL